MHNSAEKNHNYVKQIQNTAKIQNHCREISKLVPKNPEIGAKKTPTVVPKNINEFFFVNSSPILLFSFFNQQS